MIASDIPESHKSPNAMARALASYIDDPHRIRRAVAEQYSSEAAPCTQSIRRMRERYLARKASAAADTGFRCNDGYWPQDAREAADAVNRLFIERLQHERWLSLQPKLTVVAE